nr:MAG TPA: hypothetical protein [Caudoviricetes sp.]
MISLYHKQKGERMTDFKNLDCQFIFQECD